QNPSWHRADRHGRASRPSAPASRRRPWRQRRARNNHGSAVRARGRRCAGVRAVDSWVERYLSDVLRVSALTAHISAVNLWRVEELVWRLPFALPQAAKLRAMGKTQKLITAFLLQPALCWTAVFAFFCASAGGQSPAPTKVAAPTSAPPTAIATA